MGNACTGLTPNGRDADYASVSSSPPHPLMLAVIEGDVAAVEFELNAATKPPPHVMYTAVVRCILDNTPTSNAALEILFPRYDGDNPVTSWLMKEHFAFAKAAAISNNVTAWKWLAPFWNVQDKTYCTHDCEPLLREVCRAGFEPFLSTACFQQFLLRAPEKTLRAAMIWSTMTQRVLEWAQRPMFRAGMIDAMGRIVYDVMKTDDVQLLKLLMDHWPWLWHSRNSMKNALEWERRSPKMTAFVLDLFAAWDNEASGRVA